MNPRRHSHAMKLALLDCLASGAKASVLDSFDVKREELREWLNALLAEGRAAGCPAARMATDDMVPWTPMTDKEMAA